MEKKEMMLHIIENFQQDALNAPQSLLETLEEIKQQLQAMTSKEVEELDGAVINTAMESNYSKENPIRKFMDIYNEMEEIAALNEGNEQLTSTIRQMRGLFDIPDRDFP